jgi:hypothetical protein
MLLLIESLSNANDIGTSIDGRFEKAIDTGNI